MIALLVGHGSCLYGMGSQMIGPLILAVHRSTAEATTRPYRHGFNLPILDELNVMQAMNEAKTLFKVILVTKYAGSNAAVDASKMIMQPQIGRPWI